MFSFSMFTSMDYNWFVNSFTMLIAQACHLLAFYDEKLSLKNFILNCFHFVQITKYNSNTFHILTILNVCKLNIHKMITKKHKSLDCLLLVTHHFIVTIQNDYALIKKPFKIHVLKTSCASWTSINGSYCHKKLPSISRTPFEMKIGQTQAFFFIHKNEITKQNLNVKTIKQLENIFTNSSSLWVLQSQNLCFQ